MMSSPLRSLFFALGIITAVVSGGSILLSNLVMAVAFAIIAWFCFYIKNTWR